VGAACGATRGRAEAGGASSHRRPAGPRRACANGAVATACRDRCRPGAEERLIRPQARAPRPLPAVATRPRGQEPWPQHQSSHSLREKRAQRPAGRPQAREAAGRAARGRWVDRWPEAGKTRRARPGRGPKTLAARSINCETGDRLADVGFDQTSVDLPERTRAAGAFASQGASCPSSSGRNGIVPQIEAGPSGPRLRLFLTSTIWARLKDDGNRTASDSPAPVKISLTGDASVGRLDMVAARVRRCTGRDLQRRRDAA
jgi:hypothetical protein